MTRSRRAVRAALSRHPPLPPSARPCWRALAPKFVRVGWLPDPLYARGLAIFCLLYDAHCLAVRGARAYPEARGWRRRWRNHAGLYARWPLTGT